MNTTSELIKLHNNTIMKATLSRAGFHHIHKIADTLQGAVWKGSSQVSPRHVHVIKATNKYLHEQSISTKGDKVHHIDENIMTERLIMDFLSKKQDLPKSIVKYHSFFHTSSHFYLCMEYGGKPLFDFVLKAHKLISQGHLDISEWHKVIKIIFKQMIECIEYIHKYNICHYDLSLENFLINDCQIQEQHNNDHTHIYDNSGIKSEDEGGNGNEIQNPSRSKIIFCHDDIQIKCCDFGLAHAFQANDIKCKSNKYCGKSNYQCPEIAAKKTNFNAKSNDIFCIGVCLFMMAMGNAPFHIAHKQDPLFIHMFNGNLRNVIKSWGKLDYVNDDLLDLFQSFFKYENERISLKDIKNHKWFKI